MTQIKQKYFSTRIILVYTYNLEDYHQQKFGTCEMVLINKVARDKNVSIYIFVHFLQFPIKLYIFFEVYVGYCLKPGKLVRVQSPQIKKLATVNTASKLIKHLIVY